MFPHSPWYIDLHMVPCSSPLVSHTCHFTITYFCLFNIHTMVFQCFSIYFTSFIGFLLAFKTENLKHRANTSLFAVTARPSRRWRRLRRLKSSWQLKSWQRRWKMWLWYCSGQIIATSHDLTPNGRVVGEPCLQWPYFREIQVGEIL